MTAAQRAAIGSRFGRWEVIGSASRDPSNRNARVLCRCSCGTDRAVSVLNLVNGKSKSCGCVHRETKDRVELTPERVRELLHYDPETGVFTWRVGFSRVPAGSIAGTVTKGYIIISVDGVLQRAHRLAWFYAFDRWPTEVMDHLNGDPRDNRLINLREVTHAGNARNTKAREGTASGLRGVYPNGNRWRAAISLLGSGFRNLGTFASREAASQAYLEARASFYPEQPIPRELMNSAERAAFAPTSSEQAVHQLARRMGVRLPGAAA